MNTSSFEERMRERLAAASTRKQLHQEHMQQRMDKIEHDQSRFAQVANGLVSEIVRPRMQKAAMQFDNATLLDETITRGNHCVCTFQHTSRFPASTKLDIAVCPDDHYENVLLVYALEILPIFFQFDGRDQLALPLDQVKPEDVAGWVEQKLLDFVDTYLRLEEVDQYQSENVVTDPVCGMRINKNTAAASVEFIGKTLYFCIDECHRKFLADPERFVAVPR